MMAKNGEIVALDIFSGAVSTFRRRVREWSTGIMPELGRRSVILGGCAALLAGELAGCVSSGPQAPSARGPGFGLDFPAEPSPAAYRAIYGPVEGEPFPVEPVDVSDINPAFLRRVVAYAGGEAPGTIVIDPRNHTLHNVLEGGRAVRYGIGVGREGFGWSGSATIQEKREWPDWYPPKEMVQRQPEIRPELTRLQGGLGMPGGPRNPLGARALYLWQNNRDTLYRIHGTVEPQTIGTNVSSGCIRMINQDVIHLYDQVPIGAKVVVLA
jgi:lipoprotein-anchoring transpeptidase ErfK/SrfK